MQACEYETETPVDACDSDFDDADYIIEDFTLINYYDALYYGDIELGAHSKSNNCHFYHFDLLETFSVDEKDEPYVYDKLQYYYQNNSDMNVHFIYW